jgi:hypothetical protein
MAPVETLRVASEEPVHAGRESALRSLDLQMIVIAHQAVVVENPSRADDLLGEKVEEELAVAIVVEDGDSIVAARHHVMSCAGILDARLPRHTQAEATSASPASRGDRENTQGNLLGMEEKRVDGRVGSTTVGVALSGMFSKTCPPFVSPNETKTCPRLGMFSKTCPR